MLKSGSFDAKKNNKSSMVRKLGPLHILLCSSMFVSSRRMPDMAFNLFSAESFSPVFFFVVFVLLLEIFGTLTFGGGVFIIVV